MKTVAIIPAAGQGRRMGGVKKQFLEINGSPVITQTLKKFELCDRIDSVFPVLRKEDIEYFNEKILKPDGFSKIRQVIEGGEERQSSVANALKKAGDFDIVLIHDGVRPFVTIDMISNAVKHAIQYGAVITAIPMTDTVKEVNRDGGVVKTLDRNTLFRVQTPQAFKREILAAAFQEATEKGIVATDESSLVELAGFPVRIIPGTEYNLKITTKEDLLFCGGAFSNDASL